MGNAESLAQSMQLIRIGDGTFSDAMLAWEKRFFRFQLQSKQSTEKRLNLMFGGVKVATIKLQMSPQSKFTLQNTVYE